MQIGSVKVLFYVMKYSENIQYCLQLFSIVWEWALKFKILDKFLDGVLNFLIF